MPIENSDDVVHAKQWSLRDQAQAMLDVFEEDCQRPATTIEEVREWAIIQSQEDLRFKINSRLEALLNLNHKAFLTSIIDPR